MDGLGRDRETGWSRRDRAVAVEAKGFLLDWDGCCAVENKLVPGAVNFLSRHAARSAIVSNNSTNTPEDFVRILARHDLVLEVGRIFLAGVEALKRARRQHASRVMVLGEPRMKRFARRLDLPLVDRRADLVVLLRDTTFTYDRLAAAADSLANGARLIVSNPDRTHPGLGGRRVPETGALLAALAASVDLDAVEVEMVGKPSPMLYRRASEALGLSFGELAMVGDNPATDIAGADALGMPTLLVSSAPSDFFDTLDELVRTA